MIHIKKKEVLNHSQKSTQIQHAHLVLAEENNVYFSIPCSIYPKDHCPI